MERTAQNRVIFGANAKKEKSRNPHGYWIFRWRSGWDSNPRAREDYLISSQARYDHFDTAPYMFSRRFSPPFSDRKWLWKELTERTANLFNFRTGQNPHGYKVFDGRNRQLPARFRVSPVMASSVRLHSIKVLYMKQNLCYYTTYSKVFQIHFTAIRKFYFFYRK